MMLTRGFTIVELMVAIVVSALILASVVGSYVAFIQQAPVQRTRVQASGELQNLLSRIAVDTRSASSIALYNDIPDDNAPATKVGYESVPGPTAQDADYKFYWKLGPARLILHQYPHDVNQNGIYDPTSSNPSYPYDIVIYYLKGSSLYRRQIAAPYSNNSISTIGCSYDSAGGCSQDELLSSKIYPDSSGFNIMYYADDKSLLSTNSNYEALAKAKAIDIRLKFSFESPGGAQAQISDSLYTRIRPL